MSLISSIEYKLYDEGNLGSRTLTCPFLIYLQRDARQNVLDRIFFLTAPYTFTRHLYLARKTRDVIWRIEGNRNKCLATQTSFKTYLKDGIPPIQQVKKLE